MQIMSHRCRYCQKPFTRAGSKRHHERYTCWKRLENGQDKLPLVDLPSSTAITRVDAPKIILPTEKQNGIPNGIEMGEAFRFKTPSSIMIVGPSGCGKTCFTESLLLDHLEELFVNPPPTIHYCYGAWQDGFRDMKDAGVQFHEGVPTTFHLQKWFPKGGLLVLDDLMVEGGEDKELLDLFTKHSHHQNITVLYLCQDMFPPGKYAKCISRNAHYIVAFKNPRDQLGMKNLLLQAFATCWEDMMDVYQKVTERPFGYTVLDLHPASDDRKGGLLVLDDLMVEGGEDKELLDLFTKHSHHQNITVLYLCQDMFPPGKYAKCISRNAHYIVAFKNPRDQLGMKNLLLQAFPTCWEDMMDVYQKVTERPFGYTVLDLHPASDDRKRVFSHLLTHEGYPRWHRRIKKEGV